MSNVIAKSSTRITRLALAFALACSVAGMPAAALADDTSSVPAADEASQASSQASAANQQGLYAPSPETVHSNDAVISTTADGVCGVFAEAGATIIANALNVQTSGSKSIAIATSDNGGAVSVTNSQLSTTGVDAPLLQSAGTIEIDNVTGNATRSQIARVKDAGRLVINSSSLSSGAKNAASDETAASAITIYSAEENDATTSSISKTALFQASGSKLQSAIGSGSFFRLVNTTANIVLFDNDIAFDSAASKLLVAAGSDATSALVSTTKSNGSEFGTVGKNGATATFTALDQDLEGDIEVDSISSVDFYLLEDSMWTGAASITANSAGTSLATNIVVNVDATSGWIVTENSTISRLNIEKGGKLVDEKGKAVTIVDADGNKLVDGASNVEVSVTDEFSTTVRTSEANKLQASTIDRSAFDASFGTSTAFGTNGAVSLTDEEIAANLQTIIIEWFKSL